MTAIHFSSADFLEQFAKTKTKEEEARVLVRAFEGLKEDQKVQFEIKSKDLATKGDVALLRQELHEFRQEMRQEMRQELTHYATKKELIETVSTAKWQVIGSVAAMLFAEVALRHFGF